MRTIIWTAVALAAAARPGSGAEKIFAQRVVDEIKAAHPEITSLELAARQPGKGCVTIAATEAKEIGQKCDQDELTVWKTNRPFVEQETQEFDVTIPIHDAAGHTIATAGMDFQRQPNRSKASVTGEALKIGAELQQKLRSESDLFRPER
jgi:hypothetical protein